MERDDVPHRLDVIGLIRRVRRERDLSQRDLADRLGVSQPTIARIETGEISPRVHLLEDILRLVDTGLSTTRNDGSGFAPMRADAARDRGYRRLPAHLDPLAQWQLTNPWRYSWQGWDRRGAKVGWEHRATRDARRERAGSRPADHPDTAALRRPRPEPRPAAEVPDCTCPMACERWCVRECACQCEPIGLWGYATYDDVPEQPPAA